MFQITRDLLKSEGEQGLTLDAGFGKKSDIIKSLLSSFAESSEWNSYLPDHPAVIKFRNKIVDYLKNHLFDNESIRDFVFKFNLELESRAAFQAHSKSIKYIVM